MPSQGGIKDETRSLLSIAAAMYLWNNIKHVQNELACNIRYFSLSLASNLVSNLIVGRVKKLAYNKFHMK
jgi:hypothetical protein